MRIVKVVLQGDVSGLVTSMRAGGRAVADTARQMTAADKEAQKFRHGLSTLADSAGKFGLTAAIGVGAIVMAAANFDQAMSRIDAATHESAQNMELLRQAALQAGADTSFSATEAADAVTELAKAGIKAKDILGGGLDGALALAAAGQIGVAEAAEIAATALKQFRLQGEQIPHVADLLAAGAGKAQGGVGDLGMALKQSGLVASQTGLSIEETVGALSEFASAGLLGSDAGTAFKAMLQALTPNSDEAAAAIEKYNLSAYDAQGNFIGMTEFAGKLRAGLKDLTVEQQNTTLKTIFGSDAVRAAAIIFRDGAEGVDKWQAAVNEAGFAADTAGRLQNNLRGDVEKLTGSLSTLFITSGDGAQGPIRELVQGLTDFTNAINDLPGPVKNAATGLLAITAVTAGALWFGSKVIQGVANTRVALDELGITATRTKGKLSAVGAVKFAGILAAFTVVDSALSRFENRVDNADLSRNIEAFSNGLAVANFENITYDLDTIDSKLGSISEIMPELASGFGMFGNTAMDDSAADIEALDQALAGLVESGNAETAAAFLERLRNMEGVTDEDIDRFDAYAVALNNSAKASKKTTDETGRTAQEVQNLAAQAGVAAAQITEMPDAEIEAAKAAREVGQEFFGLGEHVDNTKVSLDDWIRSMENQSEALTQFTANAITAGKKGLSEGLIKELEAAGPAGALRMKQLADGTEEEIRRANIAWRKGQNAISDYVNMVVPTKDIKVRYLIEIPPVPKFDPFRVATGSVQTPADGGTIVRRAYGGTVPGSQHPYGDSVLTYLAPTEEVISNRYGQADKNRAELKAANRGAKLAVVGYASGGTTGSGGGRAVDAGYGITVYFPTPAQLKSAVSAADMIAGATAAAAGSAERMATYTAATARSGADIRQQALDDLNAQRRIRDLKRDLVARDEKGRLELRGLDRTIAKAELAEARLELTAIRNQVRSAKAEAQRERERARKEARDEGVRALREQRVDVTSTLTGSADIFARGVRPAGAIAAVNRQIADIAEYGNVVARLKGAGASPALLRQVVAKAESGDFRSAIRLGQALLANPSLMAQLNGSLATLQSVSSAVAGLTTDPRFLGAGAWSPGSIMKVVQINVGADPSAWKLEFQRIIHHEVTAQLSAAGV